MKNSGRLKKLDGVFITHYHDDHTDLINEVVKEFNCPVYATRELKDILENPSAYHMPCLTTDPIKSLTIMEEGGQLQWKDFKLTFHYFPGQTIYHDALLFEKRNGDAIFFVGDSFTPSGIDDYCLLNRNFLHPGTGYFYCLDMLNKLPPNVLLSNQHVEPLFSFSTEQIEKMKKILEARTRILKELIPFDDINYGLDEQWAAIYPYGQKSSPGNSFNFMVKLHNHSESAKTFTVVPGDLADFKIDPRKATIVIGPDSEGKVNFKVKPDKKVTSGLYVIDASVSFDTWDFHEFCEGLVEITHDNISNLSLK